MNWSLRECLPKEAGCQESFNAGIAGYINAVYQHMIENETNNTTKPRRRQSQSQSFIAPLGLDALENTAEFAKKLISGEMSQRLFKYIFIYFTIFKINTKFLYRENNKFNIDILCIWKMNNLNGKFFIICRIAQKIHRNLPEKTLTLEEYPNLDMAGKESIKINPALELIKAVCKVTLRTL